MHHFPVLLLPVEYSLLKTVFAEPPEGKIDPRNKFFYNLKRYVNLEDKPPDTKTIVMEKQS